MIESITIANVATYTSTPETLTALSQLIYLFGSNGTGKTTISRVIADESSFPACKVNWKGGTKLVEGRGFGMRTFGEAAAKHSLPVPKYAFDGLYLNLTIYRHARAAVLRVQCPPTHRQRRRLYSHARTCCAFRPASSPSPDRRRHSAETRTRAEGTAAGERPHTERAGVCRS